MKGAGVGVARAGEPGGGGPDSGRAGALFTPRIDPERTRRSAVDYLVSQGVPRKQAGARIARQAGQMRAAVALRRRAPQGVRSVWISDAGKLMAAVVNEKGRRAAYAAGATPVASKAGTDLEAVRDKLAKETMDHPPSGFNGASFEIDPVAGKVIAHYLFAANPRVPAVVQQFGDVVTASADVGGLHPQEDVDVAGATVEDDEGICTAAWAVDIEDPQGGSPGNGVMTAGHCLMGSDGQTVYDVDTVAAGNTQATRESFAFGEPGDYGFLRLRRDRGSTRTVNYDVIEKVEEPVVGVTACMYGSESHEVCGKIQRLNVTFVTEQDDVNYLLKGQVRADFCYDVGDSGAPVYMDLDIGEARAPFGIGALGIFGNGETDPERACAAYFTPLSGIAMGNYHVRIDGG